MTFCRLKVSSIPRASTLAVNTPEEIVRGKRLLEAEDGKDGFQVIRIRILE